MRGAGRSTCGPYSPISHGAAALNLRRLVNLGLVYDGTNWAPA